MFDIMLKILPNNRILARNTSTGESETMKASNVSAYIEKLLEAPLEAEKEQDEKIAAIKDQVEDSSDE
jgi:hypothetical protein